MRRLIFVAPLFAVALAFACGGDDPPGGGLDGGTNAGGDGSTSGSDGGPGARDATVIVSDADMDGLDDGWERANGLDPNRNDAGEDSDGDGLPNRIEFIGGTSPRDIDSDDDGLADGEEDRNRNGQVDQGETSATQQDSDGDGIPDGTELGRTRALTSPTMGVLGTDPARFVPDGDNASTTDPTKSDTDGDGVPDGAEDGNHNGRRDSGEGDPLDLDTDDDGIPDGTEDANHDGMRNPGETDPGNADTDGDGILDGVERGVTQPVGDPDGQGPLRGTYMPRWMADADPTSMTDPTNPDSDGDGVLDGDEDWNHNGRIDPSELDPARADTDMDGIPDANEGIAVVCAARALKPVTLHSLASADLTIALPPSVSEVVVLRDAMGKGVGFLFRDPSSGIAGFAVSRTPAAAQVGAEKQAVRTRIAGEATLSTEQDRALFTWDGFEAVVTTARADKNGVTTSALAATLAQRVAEAGALTGAVGPGSGTPGDFTLHFETALRTAQRAVVVGALAPAPTGDAEIIALSDLTNGTALAQFGDFTGVGCDSLMTPPGNDIIDLLWVVDNSCSMSQEQANVAAAGQEMVALLTSTNLSWRLALTTTDVTSGDITRRGVNGFTHSMPRPTAEAESRSWAQAVGRLGTGGDGEEKGLVVGLAAAQAALPGTAVENPLKFRAGATVVVVHMSDEEDFTVKRAAGGSDGSCPDNAGKQRRIDELKAMYQMLATDPSIAGLTTFAIHGIQPRAGGGNACDFNAGSGDCTGSSQHGRAYIEVAAGTGGGSGSICGDMSMVVQDIIRAGAGIASTLEMTQPPISSTIKVVVSDANGSFVGQPEIPRSRVNGFDYAFETDPMTRRVKHKIIFYGTARPPPNRALEISYRTWIDGSPTPGGPTCDCQGGQICNPDTNACMIDPTCGGMCPPGLVCDPQTGMCRPDDPCMGSCEANETCDLDLGICKPNDPCMGMCNPATQICDASGPTPICRDIL